MQQSHLILSFVLSLSPSMHACLARDCEPVAWWRFEGSARVETLDGITGVADSVVDAIYHAQGINGQALRFNGYTTCVRRVALKAPQLEDAFTIEAWIAPQVYPWNWTAIVNQEQDHKTGYFFGVDDEGHIGLHLGTGDQWHEVNSKRTLPLLNWSHIAASYSSEGDCSIYLNGEVVGSSRLAVQYQPTRAVDLLIGKSYQKMCPTLTERLPSRSVLSDMVFDGLIDEVKIYRCVLTSAEIYNSYVAFKPQQTRALSRRVLPTGPAHPVPFGAYYCNMQYCPEWDTLWRTSSPDVVVGFDWAPIRLVSWRGISYNPCWVTENGNWFSNEFMERSVKLGCAESMSDKRARFSHVKILESSDARVVLYWRYSPVDIEYEPPFVDLQTGWGDWAEEYWTVYPDAVAVRRIVMYSSDFKAWHEWCQSLPILQPGQKPEDVLDSKAMLSLANISGTSCTYSWPPSPEGRRVPEASIQLIHCKSQYRPFLILLPDKNPRIWLAPLRSRRPAEKASLGTMAMPMNSNFWWWNHWPVAMLSNDGRIAEFADRPSHTWTSTQDCAPYEVTDRSMTKIMLCGLSDEGNAGDLVPLARSWAKPAALEIISEGWTTRGYDQAERGYRIGQNGSDRSSAIRLVLKGSPHSPVVNPAFVIAHWGQDGVSVQIQGDRLKRGEALRYGYRRTLKGIDLVVWLKIESIEPLSISLRRQEE